MVKRRAVFLDRDGVLNASLVRDGKPYAPRSLAEFELLPGVPEALARLRQAGFLNVVVTNQPDVSNGKAKREEVEAIHAHLLKKFPIDAVKACFHTDSEGCACRKPKPGMLLEAAAAFCHVVGGLYHLRQGVGSVADAGELFLADVGRQALGVARVGQGQGHAAWGSGSPR